MKYTIMCKVYGAFYAGACNKEPESRFPNSKMPKAVLNWRSIYAGWILNWRI